MEHRHSLDALEAGKPAGAGIRPEQLELTDARVLVAIALYRRDHGHGPPWHLIAKAAGWNEWRELQERLWRLRRTGLVWFSPEPRSIRLEPGALELALDRLRPPIPRAA